MRDFGSGNIGTTNVVRTIGAKAGALTFGLDVAKGAAAVGLARSLGADPAAQAAAGLAACVGHSWPVFAKFRGGKAVATAAGALVVVSPQSFAWAAAGGVAGLALTRTVSVGSLAAAGAGSFGARTASRCARTTRFRSCSRRSPPRSSWCATCRTSAGSLAARNRSSRARSLAAPDTPPARVRADPRGLSGVDRVSAVARALTTTTAGVEALQREVVRTAAALAGDGAVAAMALRAGDHFIVADLDPQPAGGVIGGWEHAPGVLAGKRSSRVVAGHGSLLVLPMFFRGDVVGALAVLSPPDAAPRSGDTEDVLASLAGNAAIAMENARLYEQEREAVRRLRQLDAMKTDFLSTVQHEMRTPLTAILGLSDLIDMCWDTWEDTPKLDALRDIQVAAKNLDGIVETIIDFSLVDGQALVLALQSVPLAPAVRASIEAIGERHKGGLPIPAVVDVDADVTVFADPDRLGQVLRALVDNAVKFSDGRGSVTVRARHAEDGVVLIEVVDQGIGIPDGDVARIFERFFQVDSTATRRFGGTGMGLALVKRVVDAHGATVDVETKVGAGTRVVLRWPEPDGGASAAAEPPVPSPVPVQ